MKQYESYKESGIDWLGYIPSHWNLVKTSYLFEEIGSGTTPNTNNEDNYVESDGINWLQTGDLNDGYIEKTSKQISKVAYDSHSALHIYPRGSIVIAMYGATIGKVGILNIEAATNQACCVLSTPKDIISKYSYYLFIASKKEFVRLASGGGQPNISQSVIKDHKLPVPPVREQHIIASFLDKTVGKIDTVISEKEAMVEDLLIYRKSIITEIVTHGLDKDLPMKDSGINYVGQIPQHWRVSRLKFISNNFDGTHFSPAITEDGYPYITAGDVRGKGLDYDKAKKISPNDYTNLVKQGCKIEKDDVLLVKDGATTGRVGIMVDNTECVALSSVAMLRANSDIYPLYLMYLMNSNLIQTQISNAMAGAAMPRITLAKLNEFIGIVPPISEQKTIADYLDFKTLRIDETISELQSQIVDLQIYKSSIITEAVTGKIDLR